MATLLGWRTQSLGDWRRQHSGIVGNDKLLRDGLTCIFRSAAKPQPNVAKRLECVELAPALGRGGWPESASKVAAPCASRGSPAERHSRSDGIESPQSLTDVSKSARLSPGVLPKVKPSVRS